MENMDEVLVTFKFYIYFVYIPHYWYDKRYVLYVIKYSN